MSRPHRVAELRPALLGGRALPAVRRMRVRVTPAGALVHTDAAGRELPIAAPAGISRVLLLGEDDAQRLLPVAAYTGEVLVLLGADAVPLLALRLLDWAPPSWTAGATWREVTGVPALAAALQLPVEPAEDRDLDAVGALRNVLLRPVPQRPWPGRVAPLICWLALLVAVLGLAAGGGPVGAAATLLTLLLVGPIVVAGARARGGARATASPPNPAGRTVLRPLAETPTVRGLAEATLQVGPDDVVLTDRGREVWLPGPAGGGVSQVIIEPDAVRLADAAGNDYATLATGLWAPSPSAQEDLHDRLCGAGLDVLIAPVSMQKMATVASPLSARTPPTGLLSDAERGDATTTTPWVAGVVTLVALGTSAVACGWDVAAGLVLVVASGALCLLRLADTVRTAVADRRARRAVAPAAVEVLR